MNESSSRSSTPRIEEDLSSEALRRFAHDAVDWMFDYLGDVPGDPILPTATPRAIFDRFREPMPETGAPPVEVLEAFRSEILPWTTSLQHAGNLGYIPNSASVVGIVADLLASTINQNVSIVRGGPSAAAVEKQVIDWIRSLLGIAEPGGGGILTSGASLGNLMGLALARHEAGDGDALVFYASEETHSSIERARRFLGLADDALVRVPTDDVFRLRPDALEERIVRDREAGKTPAAVIATAGTIGSGAVDDLEAIGALCKRQGLWLHVDGAYGALAAAAPTCAWMRRGLACADSLSLDPHKWLFVPVDASCLLVRDVGAMRRFFDVQAEYLKVLTQESEGDVHQPMSHTVELSRRFRALKLWFVFKTYGAAAIRGTIEEHLRLARSFASWVEQEPSFELSAPVVTSTACFRFHPPGLDDEVELDRINEAVMHAVNRRPGVFISRNRLRGRFTLRACVTGLKTTEDDLRRLWDACREEASSHH